MKGCLLAIGLKCAWLALMLLCGPPMSATGTCRDQNAPQDTLRSPGNTTYYVDSNGGRDTNDGRSPDKAWRSLARVNSTVFAPGDKVLFKAGSRFPGRLKPRRSGKDGAPIVIDMYGQGPKPLIEAEGRYGEALLLENQEYWEISNLELTNKGDTRKRFRYGVRVAAWDCGTMHHIYLKNLFVHDVNGSVSKEDRGEGHGIVWENGGKRIMTRFDGLLIEGCHLLRTDRNGICGYSELSDRSSWFPSLHVMIRNNLLEDIGGDGIKPWGCDGVLVEYNRLYGGGQRCPDYSAGMWPWSCDNAVFQFNEVSGMKGTRDGQAYDSDGNCRNTLFQYNYSHDNDGGFMLICSSGKWKPPSSAGNIGTVVRYNISQNDRTRTFHIAGTPKNTRIYNNTIFVRRGLDVPLILFSDWDGWASDTYFSNNIFHFEGGTGIVSGVGRNEDGTYDVRPGFGESKSNVFENNIYYGNFENPPQDTDAITADPMLVSPGSGKAALDSLEGYKLKDGSPCIGRGNPVVDNGGRDFWGNKIPEGKKPSIGAHEK